MKLGDDRRGFVLSGAALLLVLPAMLLAASCLSIIGTGGETASLQSLSDKVSYTGRDIERVINYMRENKLPIDNSTAETLAENYRAATGLLVEIRAETPQTVTLAREKLDQGEEFELEITLFGFELEVEAENEGAVIDVEKLKLERIEDTQVVENSGEGTDFTLSVQLDNLLVEVIVGGGWIEVRYTLGAGERGVFIKIRDPRGAAQYMSTIKLE